MSFRSIRTKLELSTLAVALLPLGIILIVVVQLFETTFREDRIKLFVEQATASAARTLDDSLERFSDDLHQVATNLSHRLESSRDLTAMLDQAARRQVSPLLNDGIYDLLLVVDPAGKIVSVNDHDRFGNPLDSDKLVHHLISEFPPEADAVKQAASGALVKVDWYRSPAVNRVYDYSRDDEARRHNIAFVFRIAGADLTLVGVINWEVIQRLLDTVEVKMRQVGFDSGYAFLLKKDRDTTIGHKYRDPQTTNNYGTTLRGTHGLGDLYRAAFENRASYRYNYRGSKISGLSRIADQDFNWTVGVGLNDEDVIKPVWTVATYLGVFAIFLSAGIIFVTRWLARGITMPIQQLTASVKVIAGGHFDERVKIRSKDEIGQLALEFNRMAESISQRDRKLREQQEKLIQEEKLRREVEITKEVVRRLYPQSPPSLTTLEFHGVCLPAQQVGGDYYDFIRVSETQLGIAIGDISGKGLSAALLVSNLQASLRSQARKAGTDLPDLLASINQLFYETTEEHRYATFFYGVYDEQARLLTYVNAGHNPPVLIHAQEDAGGSGPAGAATTKSQEAAATAAAPRDQASERYELLPANASVIGLFEKWTCAPTTVRLESGDILVAYTDGVVQALDGEDEMAGFGRLIEAVYERRHLPVTDLIRELLDDVIDVHTNGQPADDIAIVVAKGI